MVSPVFIYAAETWVVLKENVVSHGCFKERFLGSYLVTVNEGNCKRIKKIIESFMSLKNEMILRDLLSPGGSLYKIHSSFIKHCNSFFFYFFSLSTSLKRHSSEWALKMPRKSNSRTCPKLFVCKRRIKIGPYKSVYEEVLHFAEPKYLWMSWKWKLKVRE